MATGQRRITDRFVKYPYPKNVGSIYQKEMSKVKRDTKVMAPHRNAFNLEKEPKKQVKHNLNAISSNHADFKIP